MLCELPVYVMLRVLLVFDENDLQTDHRRTSIVGPIVTNLLEKGAYSQAPVVIVVVVVSPLICCLSIRNSDVFVSTMTGSPFSIPKSN
jgi:hypothetical protein